MQRTMQRFLMVLTKRSKTMQYVGCKTETRVRANKKHVRDANALGISPRTANSIIINTPPRALSAFSTHTSKPRLQDDCNNSILFNAYF